MNSTGRPAASAGGVDLQPEPAEAARTPHQGNGTMPEEEQISAVRQMRRDAVERSRPMFATSASPIRTMARMVREVQADARRAGVSPAVLDREVVNRSIGDVNVRMITETVNGVDYSTIGEDLGLILPGEEIAGRISDGRVHEELHRREAEIERKLLRDYGWDMRVYDVYGVGNPYLRELLAERGREQYGLPVTMEETYISIGALDSLFKSVLALNQHFRARYGKAPSFAFPAPSFAVVNWAVQVTGTKLTLLQTSEESRFTVTYEQMKQALADDPELRLLYLTVSNNPTAFSYTPEQIRGVFRAIEEDGREFAVLADLAYVGTGVAEEDLARMAAFNTPEALQRTIFISSLSKVFTLTGDRCGWAWTQNKEWAALMQVAWNNTTAGLPAQWQLRYTAYIEMFKERPEIQEKIKTLYALRREDLRKQLHALNEEHDLFEVIGVDDDTTIYNWSKLKPGEDALTLFEKTGIAGVSGGAFGYSDQYIRFSVGFTPMD